MYISTGREFDDCSGCVVTGFSDKQYRLLCQLFLNVGRYPTESEKDWLDGLTDYVDGKYIVLEYLQR